MSDNIVISPELQGTIDQIKKNGLSVHTVLFGDHRFFFRTLNRSEWREFQKGLIEQEGTTKEDGEDSLVSKCLVSPKVSTKDLAALPAGEISTLADLILKASGFGSAETPVKL